MSFNSRASEFKETPNSSIIINNRNLDLADTCACPTNIELSSAVSVSLGLGSQQNDRNNSSNGACAEIVPTVGNSASRAPELGKGESMDDETNPAGDFEDSLEVCHDLYRVSCMDLLRSSGTESARTVTHSPAIARYICKESNLFMSTEDERPVPSHLGELLPLKPCSTFSTNPALFRDPAGVWRVNEHIHGTRTEPERGGSGGHNLLCKYCNYGQPAFGSRQHCYCGPSADGQDGGKGGMRAGMAQGYGQVESYQSAIPPRHANYSTIKTEPTGWVDYAESSFR